MNTHLAMGILFPLPIMSFIIIGDSEIVNNEMSMRSIISGNYPRLAVGDPSNHHELYFAHSTDYRCSR